MRLLTGDEIVGRAEGIVHADTQGAERGLDLTVAAVHRLTDAGKLDFGGSEFEPAPSERLEPELASPDDDYGWWRLEPGTYLAVYNERVRLEPGELGRIEPLPRLLEAGGSHAAWSWTGSREKLSSLVRIASSGCHLKENCRVSRLSVTAAGRTNG